MSTAGFVLSMPSLLHRTRGRGDSFRKPCFQILATFIGESVSDFGVNSVIRVDATTFTQEYFCIFCEKFWNHIIVFAVEDEDGSWTICGDFWVKIIPSHDVWTNATNTSELLFKCQSAVQSQSATHWKSTHNNSICRNSGGNLLPNQWMRSSNCSFKWFPILWGIPSEFDSVEPCRNNSAVMSSVGNRLPRIEEFHTEMDGMEKHTQMVKQPSNEVSEDFRGKHQTIHGPSLPIHET